jgi:hypothetical protein
MPFEASIQIFGDKQFARELRFTGKRATEARPLYHAIGGELAGLMREQFNTEGTRTGVPWAPNEPSTDAAKAAKGQPLKVFQATGELMDSFAYGDPLNIYDVTDDYLHYGSASEHGQWHQPDDKQRRVFRLAESDRKDIVKMMQHWVIYGEIGLFGLEGGAR